MSRKTQWQVHVCWNVSYLYFGFGSDVAYEQGHTTQLQQIDRVEKIENAFDQHVDGQNLVDVGGLAAYVASFGHDRQCGKNTVVLVNRHPIRLCVCVF